VLDNTYLTRAERSRVIDAAARHGVPVRCVWLDTPLAQAQVNLVERLLDRFGALPDTDELRAASRGEPGLLLPTAQMRSLRELEPPTADEGWTAIERRAFERARSRGGRPGVLVAGAVAERLPGALRQRDPGAPLLVFDWAPRRRPGRRARRDRGGAPGAGRDRGLPARRRPAELLVPTAAPRPAAGVRACSRRRPRALDALRRLWGTQDAGGGDRGHLPRSLSDQSCKFLLFLMTRA
jgi:hypothetical protein